MATPMLKNFKMYPRGFLGAIIDAPLAINPSPLQKQLTALTPSFKVSEKNPVYIETNPEVEAIYEVLINRTVPMRKVDYRKQVLLVALRAFGTISFHNWYLIQTKSSNYGALHAQFIDDTLRFIETGKRNCCLQSWRAMVNTTETNSYVNTNDIVSDAAKTFFGYSGGSPNKNISLLVVLHAWAAQPDGLSDIVQSLHLFFGKY